MKIHTCPSVGKYYGHLLSDQLIVFVEMQNFKDNVFAKINNSHGVVIKLSCLQNSIHDLALSLLHDCE